MCVCPQVHLILYKRGQITNGKVIFANPTSPLATLPIYQYMNQIAGFFELKKVCLPLSASNTIR